MIDRDVRRVAAWSVAANLLLTLVVLTSGFGVAGSRHFDDLEVERLTVVEPDGRVRMVIANRAKTPGPIEHGEPFGYGAGERAGMIFYNDEYTEAGGLIVSGGRADGEEPIAVGSLTFDQFNRDQTIALQYVENNGRRRAGIAINDYSTDVTSAEWSAERDRIDAMTDSVARQAALSRWREGRGRNRLWLGRQFDGGSVVVLGDGTGRTRLRLRVDTLGAATIEFLGEDGEVVRSIGAEG
jgi:hypothetical protein